MRLRGALTRNGGQAAGRPPENAGALERGRSEPPAAELGRGPA